MNIKAHKRSSSSYVLFSSCYSVVKVGDLPLTFHTTGSELIRVTRVNDQTCQCAYGAAVQQVVGAST
jgi:hypothetical protein